MNKPVQSLVYPKFFVTGKKKENNRNDSPYGMRSSPVAEFKFYIMFNLTYINMNCRKIIPRYIGEERPGWFGSAFFTFFGGEVMFFGSQG